MPTMPVFPTFFFVLFISLPQQASSFCGYGDLHADLTRATVKSSDWMGHFYEDNASFVPGYRAGSMIVTLRISGHHPDTLLNDFKNSRSESFEETIKRYLDQENKTAGNLEKIPAGQLAYIIQGLIAICRNPQDFSGFHLYDTLRNSVKLFDNYFQYSLVAIAFCNGGVKVPDVMVNELLKAAGRKYKPHSVDTNALILMALSCVKNSSMMTKIDIAIAKIALQLISRQNKVTGAFGNQYSTGLAVQALRAARVHFDWWDCRKAMRNILSYQDEKGSFGDILANVQVTPSLLGESMISLSKFKCPVAPPAVPKKSITVRVNLVFNDTINPVRTEPAVTVTVPKGTTAYEILELAKGENPCYGAEYKKYSFGRSITSICNVKSSRADKLYWMIYVNGSSAKYGVDGLKPKDGDLITFKYKKLYF